MHTTPLVTNDLGLQCLCLCYMRRISRAVLPATGRPHCPAPTSLLVIRADIAVSCPWPWPSSEKSSDSDSRWTGIPPLTGRRVSGELNARRRLAASSDEGTLVLALLLVLVGGGIVLGFEGE